MCMEALRDEGALPAETAATKRTFHFLSDTFQKFFFFFFFVCFHGATSATEKVEIKIKTVPLAVAVCFPTQQRKRICSCQLGSL